jgi:GLPGLI family protein
MRYLLLSLFALSCNFLIGQDITKVEYTETIFLDNINIQLPPQIAANIPKSRDNQKTLLVKGAESIYINNKEAMEKQKEEFQRRSERAGGNFSMRRGRSNEEIYNNIDNLQMVTFTELFGKEFLIEEEAEYSWKIHAGEQRDILGHTCVKATYMKDTTLVTAWYTPKLNVPSGPGGYNGLPGLILALSEGENKVYLATKIFEDFAEAPEVVKPTKGDKVTREKFNQIREEKMKEMGKMWSGRGGVTPGGGGPIIIRQ